MERISKLTEAKSEVQSKVVHHQRMTYYTPQAKEFYVYVLRNPLKEGCPSFYVGKGKGKRAFQHQMKCREDENPYKTNTINQIRNAGHEIVISVAWNGTDERRAFAAERLLIAIYGRKCDGGILTNLTKGGDGASGFPLSEKGRQKVREFQTGRTRSPETRRKMGDAKRGTIHSLERRRKSSEARKGKPIGHGGENNPGAKLTNQDVLEIRNADRTTHGYKEKLAERFHVTERTIRNILKNRRWNTVNATVKAQLNVIPDISGMIEARL